jgi:hypothetical protein
MVKGSKEEDGLKALSKVLRLKNKNNHSSYMAFCGGQHKVAK